MRRKKREEEHENHERWLVSYADFITLLFAFFVVMYAISSVNEGKYRVLSNTMVDAFQQGKQGSADPIQIGEAPRSPLPTTEDPFTGSMASSLVMQEGEYQQAQQEPLSGEEEAVVEEEAEGEAEDEFPLEPIAESIKESLSPFIEKGLAEVTSNPYWIEVEIKSKMLFTSGSARLAPEALTALRDIASILKSLPNVVHVEGHTDNIPIKTISFPSNWELSAARAASVVHLFTRLGMDPKRLAAIGYGEHRPLSSNEEEVGRQKNRRVSLVIMAERRDRKTRTFPVPPSGDAR
ncbi:flagellar motor protein MotD [Pseudomonadota bacterium]